MMNYFRIHRLNLDLPYLKNFEIKLGEDGYTEKPYISIIIGPNGTRKSLILKAIINIFRELDFAKNNNGVKRNFVGGEFFIQYSLNGDIYEFSSSYGYIFQIKNNTGNQERNTKLHIEKNEKRIGFDEVIMPNFILANTIMLTDKFPIVKDENEFTIYKYLGVRNERSPLSAGTRQYIRKTVNFIVESANKPKFFKRIREVLKNLDFEIRLTIRYIPKYRNIFFNKNLSIEEFINAFEEWEHVFEKRKTEPWGKRYFTKIKKDRNLLNKILEFLNNVKIQPYGSGGSYFEYDLLLGAELITGDFDVIKHLSKLDLISYPELRLYKNQTELEIRDSSSGEIQLISSLIAIAASIEENSLILIDEPEISLHPNWQMRYLNLLETVFNDYKNCHFILASHSHFIISDRKQSNSTIIGLTFSENDQIITHNFDVNTYGWSAEEILLKVFKTASTRNYYLAEHLGDIFELLPFYKEKDNKSIIIEKINELKRMNLDGLSNEDPLKIVIDKLFKKF